MNLPRQNEKCYIVPDLLVPNLKLVFCGTAPSRISAAAKAYYANPGNRFWQSLHEFGFTPQRFVPTEYSKLLELGIGLTDVCKTEIGNDDELSREGLDHASLRSKIEHYQPGIVAFTSKNAAAQALGRRTLTYGLQPETIGKTKLFALPSTSGRARVFWQAEPWRELGEMFRKL